MNEDIKNVVSEALQEVKDNALHFVKNTVFPYVDEAVKDFQDAQTVDAEKSTSGWVKIRAKLINTSIDLVWSITKKVVTKILEKAADDETAPAVQ